MGTKKRRILCWFQIWRQNWEKNTTCTKN